FAPARRLRRDVRIEESWSMLGPYRWLVERSSTGSDSAWDFQSLGPQPLWRKSGASALPRTSLPLTEPSLLSRGTRQRTGVSALHGSRGEHLDTASGALDM